MARKSSKKNTGIKLVKKANKLVESRYKFDIWETRLFLSVLAKINREDDDFQVYRISYKDVIKAFGLKSGRSYEFLRDAAKALMRKVFYVTNYDNGYKRETEYHIIRSVNYLAIGEQSSDNQDYIDITIDPEMKPLLLQLGNNYKGDKGDKGEDFTAYDLRNVIKLGAYHVRIYELLKQYQKIGKRKLEVEEIKRMLEIGTEYPLFGNFLQKVINPAIKKINDHTDLTITKMEKVRRGRKVIALYFEFSQKRKDDLKKQREEARQKQLDHDLFREEKRVKEESVGDTWETEKGELFNLFFKDVVERFGVTPSVFLKLLKAYNEEQVAQAVRVTNRAKFQNQIKTNVAGFFILALKNGYTDQKEAAKKQQIGKEKEPQHMALLRAKMKDLEIEKATKINERIKVVVTEQPDITNKAIALIKQSRVQKILIANKEKALGRPLEIEDYREDRILRDFVINHIMVLAKDRFVDILEAFQQKAAELRKQEF